MKLRNFIVPKVEIPRPLSIDYGEVIKHCSNNGEEYINPVGSIFEADTSIEIKIRKKRELTLDESDLLKKIISDSIKK